MDLELYAKVRKSAVYCRDIEVRKKVNLFMEAIRGENVQAACMRHGVVPKTYYCWWNRFVGSGFDIASLVPRSRKPHNSPAKTKGRKLKWIRYYRTEFRYGPERIQMYLKINHGIAISRSTIGEVIKREGLRLRRNRKMPLNKHTRRYSLPWPGDRVQMDIKYVPRKINEEQFYVFNAIDDCTRWRMSKLYCNKGIPEAVDFLKFVHRTAPFIIKCIQLDNDTAFTYRLTPNCFDKIHPFESTAKELDIRLKFIPPGEKELQGKVERLHRTDDDEFFWKAPLVSLGLLKHHLDLWTFEYNHYRHHKELGWKTPEEMLESKAVDLWALFAYIANCYRPLKWPCLDTDFGPKISTLLGRYLQFLEWCDSQYLPVTDVSGYYNRKSARPARKARQTKKQMPDP
jgi:transposase InsO family protein